MTDYLLPCALCGCTKIPKRQGNGAGDYWLECIECGMSTRLREDGNGIKDWNRRPTTESDKQEAVKPCTCHPDDNPPVPCAQQYALNECRAESDKQERAAWSAITIEAAAYIEDAANCLRDPDAKRAAKGAAEFVRKRRREILGAKSDKQEALDFEATWEKARVMDETPKTVARFIWDSAKAMSDKQEAVACKGTYHCDGLQELVDALERADSKGYLPSACREAWEAFDFRAVLAESDKQEAVGVAVNMPGTDGFTMACFKAADVPVGTKLYAHPIASAESDKQEALGYTSQQMLNGISDRWPVIVYKTADKEYSVPVYAHPIASADANHEFEWPKLPRLPDPMMYSPQNGLPMFSGHQMQGYANAYGEAVRIAANRASEEGEKS